MRFKIGNVNFIREGIKKIGMDARRAIEAFMGYKVYLELFVKVDKKWRENPKSLKRLGFS